MTVKRIAAFLLIAVFLLALSGASASGGKLAVSVPGSRSDLNLTILDYGFNEDRTVFTVTVNGYNFLKSGETGSVEEIMPFKIGIAYDGPDNYMVSSSFGVTEDPVTIAYFSKEDNSPMEEPLYIVIAPKEEKIKNGWHYVIAEDRFYDAYDIYYGNSLPKAVDPRTELQALKAPGSYVLFGSYPQTRYGGVLPIEWLVLDYDETGHRSLLVSRYGLDEQRYQEGEGVTWENSIVRSWLNSDFLQEAFSSEEQSAILTTEVDNSAAQGFGAWETDGGNNTQDRVFLLSYAEAERYFGLSDEPNEKVRVAWTDYQYPYVPNKMKHTSNDLKTEEHKDATSWMLRSPGENEYSVAVVDDWGLIGNYRAVDYHCVRPALWVDDGAEIFLRGPETAGQDVQAQEEQFRTVGAYVTFGTYPQTRLGTDQTPIEWLVLDYDETNHRALLLSRYGLDSQRYNAEKTEITWENCSLRIWLNNDFLQAAFSPEEQQAILTTAVDNSRAQGYQEDDADGGNDTQDQVFLLSYAEANRYLGVVKKDKGIVLDAIMAPTSYAVHAGAPVDGTKETASGESAGSWWLRSPSYQPDLALRVSITGEPDFYSGVSGRTSVRPALWVDLDAVILP